MPTALIAPPVLQNKPGEHVEILEAAGFAVRQPDTDGRQLIAADVPRLLDGVDAVLAGPEPYTAETFEQFPKVRVISRAGVGYDAVDLKAAARHGVPVAFTPGTNHEAVAEHVFTLLFGIVRRVVENHQMVAGGEFRRRIMVPVRGRTLGIVGMGRIGKSVAARALAFGMKVLAFEPYARVPSFDGGSVEQVELNELLQRSDVITLHAPKTAETQHLVRAETIEKMKDKVILINTARGGLVDERALRSALDSGKVAAAGLDVFENEPPIGSPMLDAPNVVLSPHVAAMDTRAVEETAILAAQTIVDLYEGRWPAERIVNADGIGPGWQWSP